MAASYLIDYLCCEDIVPSIQQVVEDDQQKECQHYQQQIFKYFKYFWVDSHSPAANINNLLTLSVVYDRRGFCW